MTSMFWASRHQALTGTVAGPCTWHMHPKRPRARNMWQCWSLHISFAQEKLKHLHDVSQNLWFNWYRPGARGRASIADAYVATPMYIFK